MKFTSTAAGAALAGLALSAPLEVRQSTNIDNTILQFALTLEHLENVFYKSVLSIFSQQDFADAGFGADYFNNLVFMAQDEEVHVEILETTLLAAGCTPVAACNYAFPITDVLSFVTLSSILEGVGTSAYLAAAPLISSKDVLAVAGSILVTEALHTSLQRGSINEVPMANPFGTPLGPAEVFSLAASFIVSCPSTNAPLPFVAFAGLAVSESVCTCEEPFCSSQSSTKTKPRKNGGWKPNSYNMTGSHDVGGMSKGHRGGHKSNSNSNSAQCSPPFAGETVIFTAVSEIPQGSYVTFISGLAVVSVRGFVNGNDIQASIPSVAQGQTYVVITRSDQEGVLLDSEVLFGPAVLEVFPSPATLNFGVLKK